MAEKHAMQHQSTQNLSETNVLTNCFCQTDGCHLFVESAGSITYVYLALFVRWNTSD